MMADSSTQAMERVHQARLGALISLVLAILPVQAMPAHAAEASPGKIGYVNLAKVFDGYVKTKQLDATLEKKGKAKEAELEGRMNELKQMRKGLELLADDAKEGKAREIEEKAEELQRFRNTTARDLRRERDKIAKDLLGEIQKALEEFAKANGYSVVLDSQSLLYGQDSHDVSDELLAALNKRATAAAQ
jgi:outer membrane protein